MPDTIPKRYRDVINLYGDLDIFMYKDGNGKDFKKQIFSDFWNEVKKVGSGLLYYKINRGEKVALIADSRREWVIIDIATMGLGCIDVPRGNDSPEEEVNYIINHSEASFVFVENEKQLQKILVRKHDIKKVRYIIVIDGDVSYEEKLGHITVLSYKKLLEVGNEYILEYPRAFDTEVDKGNIKDIATIIYTSGTTGFPKGVVLRHESFIFQLDRIYEHLPRVEPGKVALSVLPLWHSFERICHYILTLKATAIAYSKPVGPILLKDFATINPNSIVSVPRIWEGVRIGILKKVSESFIKKLLFSFFLKVGIAYSKLQDTFLGLTPIYRRPNFLVLVFSRLFSLIGIILLFPLRLLGNILVFGKIKRIVGKNYEFGISGGGALVDHVDYFFKAVGIKLLEGYGLTETGPILSVRRFNRPVAKTVGDLLPDIQYKVLDSEGRPVKPGEKGELWIKSGQVMSCYYKDEAKTNEVLTKDGWFKTGDLVLASLNNEITIVGRSKDTIVLRGGENIEPEPLESVLSKSLLIDNILIVGQDQKFLGAIIVPNFENLEKWAKEHGISYSSAEDLILDENVNKFYSKYISDTISPKVGFKSFERIVGFTLLKEVFQVGEELTNTLKPKRHFIYEKYKDKIDSIFNRRDLELDE